MIYPKSAALAAVLATALATAVVPSAHAEPAQTAAPAATSVASGALFVPMVPQRVLDTRLTGKPIKPPYDIRVHVGEHVPAAATAVVLNLTGTNAANSTHLSVTPMGSFGTTVSNLNLAAGETRANLVTTGLGGSGSWRGFSLSAGRGPVDAIVDLAGYYLPGSGAKYTPQPPQRVLDTRDGLGAPKAPVGAGATITLNLNGKLPASATSAVFNLTGTNATESTFVTAYPHGGERPTASNINLVAGKTTPNLATVKLGPDQTIDLFNNTGSTDLLADLAGYYAEDGENAFYPLVPTRVLETRGLDGQPGKPLGPDGSRTLDLGNWLPPNARAAVFNLTGTNPTAATYVSAWPTATPRPVVSNLNLVSGQTAPNLAIVAVGEGGRVELRNNAGQVDLVADLAGYFAAPSPSCAANCVLAWSDNRYGDLGNGTTSEEPSTRSEPVYGLSDVKAVASDPSAGFALKNDGTVWAWGRSIDGSVDGIKRSIDGLPGWTTTYEPMPVQVPGLSDVVEIGAGFAIKADRTLWAWGYNYNFRLGTGTGNFQTTHAKQVPGMTDIEQVAASKENGYALKSDGTVWAWGNNGNGQLGNGTDGGDNWCQNSATPGCGSAVPVKVSGLTDVVSIGARLNGGMAVKADGTVWTWGLNGRYGELGTGTECTMIPGEHSDRYGPGCRANVPVQVTALSGVRSVAGFWNGAYAVKNDGTVWSWGYGRMGELGDGRHCYNNGADDSACVSKSPVQVVGLTGVAEVASYLSAAFARKTDGSVWMWGFNSYGEHPALGSGPVAVPVQVPGLVNVSSIASDGYAVVPTL